MPDALPRACRVMGCSQGADCPTHRRRTEPEHHSLYDTRRWRHSRHAFLRRFPRCGDRPNQAPPVMSQCRETGRIVPATHVDHVVPHKGDRVRFWDQQNNWQALCASCSGRKSQAGL